MLNTASCAARQSGAHTPHPSVSAGQPCGADGHGHSACSGRHGCPQRQWLPEEPPLRRQGTREPRQRGDGARCWPHTGGRSCGHVLGNRASHVAQRFGTCTFQVVAACEGRGDRAARAGSRPPPVGTLPALNGCLTETNDRGSFRNNFLLI